MFVFALAPGEACSGGLVRWAAKEPPFVPPRYADLPTLGRLTGRGQHRQRRGRARGAARLHRRLRLGAGRPTLRSPIGCSSRPACRICCSTARSASRAYTRIGDYSARRPAGASWRDTRSDMLRRIAARREVPPDRRPRRLLRAGAEGLDTGLAGPSTSRSSDWARSTSPAGSAGAGAGLGEQVLAWDPDVIVTIDPNFFASARRPAVASACPRCGPGACTCRPGPFGWIDFPPSINRLIGLAWLARILYPEQFPEDLRRDRGFLRALYHQTPTEGPARRARWRRGAPRLDLRASTPRRPSREAAGFLLRARCWSRSCWWRLRSAGIRSRRRAPRLFWVQAHRGADDAARRGGDRGLPRARPARRRRARHRRRARRRRRGIPEPVPQPARVARHPRRVRRRGARRRARHLSLARRRRASRASLSLRPGRGARSTRSAPRCAATIRSWCWCWPASSSARCSARASRC